MTLTYDPNFFKDPNVKNVGSLNKRWKTYQNTDIPENQLEIGSDIGKGILIIFNLESK